MKKILLLLLSVAAIYPLPAADTDWHKAAREFMAEQDIAPIEIKPGTRFEADRARDRWAWMQRVFLPPFEQHLTQWPRQAEAARSFVKQALMIRAVHPDVDPKRPWEVLAQEGATLIKEHVDDPLVFWLAAVAVWEFREGTTEARDYLSKAGRHKMIKDYPSVLLAFIKADINEIGVHRNSTMETIARLNIEQYQEMMKSVPDPAVYLPQDDELLLADLEFIFGNINIKAWSAELEQLSSTPHFSPWLREMLRGRRQNFIAWDHRNGGGDTTGEERSRKVAEHQIQARAHFIKAWELRPDRAAGAASMIEIVKSGNGRPEDNVRQWFDRAINVDFDNYIAYFQYLEALRPHWGGSLAKMKAFYCACALTERDGNTLMRVMQLAHDDIEEDSREKRSAFSLPPMKEVLLASFRRHAASQQVYRRWEHPWRLANLGVFAWQVEDYETAYETFQKVPVPFPRQSRRRLDLAANETDVRGYNASLAARLSAVQNEWKTKALHLAGTTERNEVTTFIRAELEPRTITAPEEPLAAANAFKWQQLAGEWTRTAEVLAGSGDSTMRYELNRKPPFQIEFDINVHEGNRPRLHFGKLKFANESGPTTFGLYPLPKGTDAKLFPYEHNKWYHVTITATAEKTELSINGTKICDGPKIEGEVGMLQFRGGDWSSKGRTEFRKIRISPLP